MSRVMNRSGFSISSTLGSRNPPKLDQGEVGGFGLHRPKRGPEWGPEGGEMSCLAKYRELVLITVIPLLLSLLSLVCIIIIIEN